MRLAGRAGILIASMTLALALAASALLAQAAPPPAQPAGIARFRQVDSKLYRGAQPDAAGLRSLRDLGVATVINLRIERDAIRLDEQRIVESLGMRYVALPIEDGNFFTRSRIIPQDVIRKFFAVIDAAEGPVFVHCHRGADRTGALIALYRIARHGWSNRRAYEEARGVGMRSWYDGLKRQILTYRAPPEIVRGSRP